ETRRVAAVRCDASEDPGTALLIHQAARAVDRIDDQSPATVLLGRATRQHERLGEALRNHTYRLIVRQPAEAALERLLAHAVDGIDRVSGVTSGPRELFGGLARTRVHHGVADSIVQPQYRVQEQLDPPPNPHP